MLSYRKVAGKSYVLQSLTGLNQQEFEHLLKSFDLAWQDYLEREYISKPRARNTSFQKAVGYGKIRDFRTLHPLESRFGSQRKSRAIRG